MSSTFHVINLGCKVNRVEADDMTAGLLAAGAALSALEDADVVLINTCTVTGEADTKSRKALHRALKLAKDATVIVCGCGAATDPAQFETASGPCHVVADKDEALLRAGEILGLAISEDKGYARRVGEGFNTRVAVKVQDGCDNACSYCIVPKARGRARSLSLDKIVHEVTAYSESGTREIVLTGIDLGNYLEGQQHLVHLLRELLALGGGCRFRLSSIELPGITDELIQLIAASNGRICAHLHIPLQSGSDAVLKAMRRRYDRTAYLSRIQEIKKVLPHIAISTDVIVGFPGESEKDFSETLIVCEEVGYSRIHTFRYSKRPGTVAADLPGHLAPAQVAQRAGALRSLAERLMEQDAQRRIGSEELVLIESVHQGRSESYYPVRLVENTDHTESVRRGNLVTMRIVGYEQGELTATEC